MFFIWSAILLLFDGLFVVGRGLFSGLFPVFLRFFVVRSFCLKCLKSPTVSIYGIPAFFFFFFFFFVFFIFSRLFVFPFIYFSCLFFFFFNFFIFFSFFDFIILVCFFEFIYNCIFGLVRLFVLF